MGPGDLPGPPLSGALAFSRSKASVLFSCPYLCRASPSLWALHPPLLLCVPASTCPVTLHLPCPLFLSSLSLSHSLSRCLSLFSSLCAPGYLWLSASCSVLSPFCVSCGSLAPPVFPSVSSPSASVSSFSLCLPLAPPPLLPPSTPLSPLSLSSPPVGHRWAPSS